MKKFTISLVLLFCISLNGKSQNTDKDIADAKKALGGFYDALGQLDMKKAKQFMSPNYAEADDGEMVSADSLEKNVTANKKTVKSEKGKYSRNNTYKYIQTWANGNTVMLVYKIRSVIKYNQDSEEINGIETAILEKDKEGWKIVHLHFTKFKSGFEEEED